MVALEIAQRTGIGPFEVMQNMDVIHGRPSWKSSYIIARINSCGRFQPLEFEFEERGKKTVEHTQTEWVSGQKKRNNLKTEIMDKACRVVTESVRSGRAVVGPWVSLEMAVKEGWYTKDGSKWQTMPDVMLQYRAASFFGRMNAPDALLGMHTTDEVSEVAYADSPSYVDVTVTDQPSRQIDPISEINAQVAVDEEAPAKKKSRKRQNVTEVPDSVRENTDVSDMPAESPGVETVADNDDDEELI